MALQPVVGTGEATALQPQRIRLLLRGDFNAMTQAQRALNMIQSRLRLKRKYASTYRNVATILDVVRTRSNPAVAQLDEETLGELERGLVEARDQVARAFTQILLLFENAINEIAPGTFPRGDVPLMSFDLGDWLERGLNILIDFLEWAADGLGGLGWDEGEAALDAAANGLRDAEEETRLPGLAPSPYE